MEMNRLSEKRFPIVPVMANKKKGEYYGKKAGRSEYFFIIISCFNFCRRVTFIQS